MVLLSIFLHESDPWIFIQDLLFIHFVAPCAYHLAVKILLQIFCMKIWARWPYIHLSVVFPSRMPAGPHFVTQPILLSENIPNIWHKSSTKHKEVADQIETIKTIMQTTRPRITWRFYQWLRLPFLKKYSIKCEKISDCELFYSELKRHNVSH